MLRSIRLGLRRLLDPKSADRDLDDEIAQYVAAAAEELVRNGMSRSEAERKVRLEFGGVEAAKEAVRDAGWESVPDTVRRDLGFGLRMLRRNPGFTIVALLTLAIGIGAATAMFSVLEAVIFQPLPYRDAGRLALIWTDDTRRGLHEEPTAYRTIEDWRRDTRSFSAIGFFNHNRATIAENGERERSHEANVSGNLFAILGVNAELGRTLTVADEASAASVAVISHALWQRHFHGDSAVIGKTLTIEGDGKGGSVKTVVGVMPASFYFPNQFTEFWSPATNYWRFNRESIERFPDWTRRWTGIARLKDGTSLDDARADLARVGDYLTATYPPTVAEFPGFRTNLTPILDSVAGTNLRTALWVLMGGVVLVLLVACANVANLLLARGGSRRTELILRQAIGARRSRLIGQLMAESVVLAVVGGIAGVTLAWAGVRAVALFGAAQVPRLGDATLNGRVLLFALLSSLIAGMIFGVAPAIGLTSNLYDGTRASSGIRARRTRHLLVVAECAVAIVLLAGAGLLLRSLRELSSANPGFDPAGVLAVRLEFPPENLPAGSDDTPAAEKLRAMHRYAVASDLARRVAAIPGVAAVGYTDDMFLAGSGHKSVTIPGRPNVGEGSVELTDGLATPGFFQTLRVQLVRGRYLTDDDAAARIEAMWAPTNNSGTLDEREARAVFEPVVVNAEFARRFFPGENPLGKRFCVDPTNKTYWYTIVGVVGDMRRQGLARAPIAQYYGPWFPMPLNRTDLLVRATVDPLTLADAVRRAVKESMPGVIVASVSTVGAQLSAFDAQRALQARLLSIFAALAIVLAAVGIYGVVHYTVNERTQELGVRIALGATPAKIRALVVRDGMRGPVIGIAIGMVAGLAATRVLSATLYGVTATDPATYAAVGALLLAVAAIACLVPAIRATKVDPITALRRD